MPERIVFILSTARTGTKSLAEGLAGGDVCSPHQPPYSRPLTIAGNFYLNGWLPQPVLTALVRRWREPQIRQAACRYYVQVFSLDYMPAFILSQRLPHVHIIHLIRDPRTWVPSYLNWMHTRWQSAVANKLIVGWHPSGFWTGEIPLAQWLKMDAFQRTCWHWTYKNRLLETLFANYPAYQQVHFEALFGSEGARMLQSMLEKAGIPYQERYAGILRHPQNQSRRDYFPTWPDLPAYRQQQLLSQCGDLMRQYGYLDQKTSRLTPA